MIVGNMNQLVSKDINSPAALHASMKVLVSPKEGWEGHVMRVLDVQVGGYTPKHSHDWPHINYIIEGEGELFIDGVAHPVSAGSYAYVPANSLHQFKNVGQTTFKFMCIVPEIGHQY
ncbi:MAG: cupin domain-containing protein [Firmicutes bacterium]|nr:cupin domain-containing protein [Bacillota bacterium]